MNSKKIVRCTLFAIAGLLILQSCNFISGFFHDDKLVASLGKQKLYVSDIAAIIPAGTSPEDSVNMSLQYINSWASEILFSQVAENQLSKAELDVTKEIEDYKRSLYKYRYEQRYINDRLDTLVSAAQIEEYYRTHRQLFVLDVPIVKARFLDIMQESPNLEILKSKMSSEDYIDLAQADSLAYSSALKYSDTSDKWVDMVTFARNFGVDYGTLLSKMDSHGFIEIPDERGDIKIAYICDIKKAGTVSSLEYSSDRIRDIIISSRRHALLSTLEQELLEQAKQDKKLMIY